MKNCVCRFIVTSDIHYKADKETEHERFRKGMKMAYDYAENCDYKNIDAYFAVGDFVNSGAPEEMKMFKKDLDECIAPETDKTLVLASHEFFYNGPEGARERFSEIFKQPYDVHKIINGFHFIATSCIKSCNYSDETIDFLKQSLREAADDDWKKPIFVFQHPHPQSTVYGSTLWGETDFLGALQDYPQVIDFSGHSHAPINDPRSVHQEYFTSFGTGSLSYFELDEFNLVTGTIPENAHECAQFYIVEVYEDNSVKVIPVDILSGNFFNDGIVIETPWDRDSFIYTDARKQKETAPVFAENTPVDVEYSDGKLSVTFAQAIQTPERTDSYIVIVKNAGGRSFMQKEICSSYYLYNMPEKITLGYPVSLPDGNYTVEIVAKGFFGAKSEKITKEFTV